MRKQDWQDETQDEMDDWEWQARQDRFRFAYGMSDFFGVVLGVIVILLLVLLILSLLNWLRQDISSTFISLLGKP